MAKDKASNGEHTQSAVWQPVTLPPGAPEPAPRPKRGRPKKHLDERMVRVLAERGDTLKDMAAILGVSKRTILRRFRTLIRESRGRINSKLRSVQLKKAFAGDTRMLVWMGMQRLKQTARRHVDTEIKGHVAVEHAVKVHDAMRTLKSTPGAFAAAAALSKQLRAAREAGALPAPEDDHASNNGHNGHNGNGAAA